MKRKKALKLLYEEGLFGDEKTLRAGRLQKAVDALHPEEVRPSLSAQAALGSFYDRNGIERPESLPEKAPRRLRFRRAALAGGSLCILLICIAAVPRLTKKGKAASEASYVCSENLSAESKSTQGLKNDLRVTGTYGLRQEKDSIDSAELDETQLERIWDFLRKVDIFNAFDSPMSLCTEESDDVYEIVLDVSYREDYVEYVFFCDSEKAYNEMKEENLFVRFFEKLLSFFVSENEGLPEPTEF